METFTPLSLFNHPVFSKLDFLEGKRRHRGIISVGLGSFFSPRTDEVKSCKSRRLKESL